MKDKIVKPSIFRYIAIAFFIFGVAIVVSSLTRMILATGVQSSTVTNEQVGWITNMIEGAVSSIAAAFVLYQFKLSDCVERRQNDIEEASFILKYNQAFICDSNMCEVEHKMEQQMEHGDDSGEMITDENRQLFINYLVYLESLAPLVFRGALQLEHIDDLMAYRFFLALNNREMQEDQLFRYPDYYRGCFKLYRVWKNYRKTKGYPILQEENSIDKWCYFEKYADSDIKIRKLNRDDDLKTVSALLYDTDEFIYPVMFGNKRNAKRHFPTMIRSEKGLFSFKNIQVAEKDNKIVGVIVTASSAENVKLHELEKMKVSTAYMDVYENYFQKLPEMFVDEPTMSYIACLCVSKKHRGQQIGGMLLKAAIQEHSGRKIVLDVLADNKKAIELYEKYDFVIDGDEKDGYAYQTVLPKCYTMVREN